MVLARMENIRKRLEQRMEDLQASLQVQVFSEKIGTAIRKGRCDSGSKGNNAGSHNCHYIRNQAVDGGEKTEAMTMATQLTVLGGPVNDPLQPEPSESPSMEGEGMFSGPWQCIKKMEREAV